LLDAGVNGHGKENHSDRGTGASGASNVPGPSRGSRGSRSGSETGSRSGSNGSADGGENSGSGAGGDDPNGDGGDDPNDDGSEESNSDESDDEVEDDEEEEVAAETEVAEDQDGQVPSSNPGSPVGAQGKNWLTFESLMAETYPAKSKEIYLSAFRDFELFLKSENKFVLNVVPNETMLLNYFRYLKNVKKWAPTSIWSQYSHLNGVLKRRFRFSLKEFPSVTDLLKSYEVGHRVKKASVFSPQQERFCYNVILVFCIQYGFIV
jgi:hypothetical protein